MTDQQNELPRRRLGRGISALLGGSAPAHEAVEHDGSDLRHIPVTQIVRNPWQPRKDFDQVALAELSASIREHGVLQPLLVRELDGGYQLIAGERRWLAAQKAGLEQLPCLVVDVIDKTACEFALEENLKRKDLSDLEKARAFKDYLDEFHCTVEELARQLSMSRSAVSNLIRLLDLTEPVRNALQAGKITAGHARALLPLEAADQLALCGRIQAEGLNVRKTEEAVKQLLGRSTPPAPVEAAQAPDGPGAQPAPNDATMTAPSAEQTGEAPAQVVSEQEESAGREVAEAATTDGDAADVLPMASGSSAEDSFMTNHVRDLQDQLRNLLATSVDIRLKSKDSGQIVIHFANGEQFERIIGLMRERAAA